MYVWLLYPILDITQLYKVLSHVIECSTPPPMHWTSGRGADTSVCINSTATRASIECYKKKKLNTTAKTKPERETEARVAVLV